MPTFQPIPSIAAAFVTLWLVAFDAYAFISPSLFSHYQRADSIGRVSAQFERLSAADNPSPLSPVLAHGQARSTSLCAVMSGGAALSGVGDIIGRSVSKFGGTTTLLREELGRLTPVQTALFGAAFLLGLALGRVRPFWRRLTSVADVPRSYFGPTAGALRGHAVTVTDGDTIRLLHRPTWLHPSEVDTGKQKGNNRKRKERVSEVALPIRVCTIDTPETAKFGKSGQPFGEEAKDRLKKMLDGKTVKARLLQRDQYGRAVGEVFTGRWPFRRYVDEEMLKAGLAEVYQGSGAVYGPKGKDEYLEMENVARKQKIGIWSQKKRESAAEYKRRTKQ